MWRLTRLLKRGAFDVETSGRTHDTAGVYQANAVVRRFAQRSEVPPEELGATRLSHLRMRGKTLVGFLSESSSSDVSALRLSAERMKPSKGFRYAHALNDEKRRHDAGCVNRCRTPAAFYDVSEQFLIQMFPYDRRLPALSDTCRTNAMAKILGEAFGHRWFPEDIESIDVMRYKPQRKCVLRYTMARGELGASTVYAKFMRRKIFAHSNGVLSAIHDALAGHDLTVARPLVSMPGLGLEVAGAVAGVPLSEVPVGATLERYCAYAAGRLKTFHELPVDPGHRLVKEDTIMRIAESKSAIAALFGGCATRAAELAGELSMRIYELEDVPASLIHHDFHGGNVLVKGEEVGFIDLEDCTRGDAADDLGSMCAYFVRLSLERPQEASGFAGARAAFLAGYPGAEAMRVRVALYTALYCFFQALQQLRRPDIAARYRNAECLLQEGESLLRNGLTLGAGQQSEPPAF